MRRLQPRSLFILCLVLASAVLAEPLLAQGPGRGRGFGRGQGRGFGPGAAGEPQGPGRQGGPGRSAAEGTGAAHDDRHAEDHEVFQFLLTNHDKIRRTVKELPSGVETLTESDDPAIAAKIKEHVEWMEVRIEEVNPIRMRDPLFAEIFRHADKIDMQHEETEGGVRVTETSADPYVVKLIQAHAKAVSGFVEHGFAEAMKNHPVPGKQPTTAMKAVSPKIVGHGQVVRLPEAAQQPRDGTLLCVDLTAGGQASALNPGLEKVARYVNIYAAAGEQAAEAKIAVVLHGDATLTVLNADAYAAKFGTDGNPNFELLHQLHEQGVEFYVCGQTLINKGAKPEEVMVFVDVAVSALTSLVNLEMDGYHTVPLH